AQSMDRSAGVRSGRGGVPVRSASIAVDDVDLAKKKNRPAQAIVLPQRDATTSLPTLLAWHRAIRTLYIRNRMRLLQAGADCEKILRRSCHQPEASAREALADASGCH